MSLKKLLFICLSLLIGVSVYSNENNLGNGLGVKLFAGIPKDGYGSLVEGYSPYDENRLTYPDVSPIFGMSVDSRWYLTKPALFGVAINVRWADVSYSWYNSSIVSLSIENPYQNKNVTVERQKFWLSYIDISALGVGVLGTCFFNDKTGLDLYYNIAPNLLIIRQDVSENFELEYNKHTFALGVTHFAGLAFRYKIFQVGSEVKLGTPNFQNWGERKQDVFDYNNQRGYSTFRTSNLRFFVGVKF